MATFGTFTSGQVLTAAELNTAGSFQTYTPTWTQSVAITKTVNWARYSELNKLVYVSIKMTASSSGTSSNKILVGLPVNASANNFLMGQMVYDNTIGIAAYYAVLETSSTVSFFSTRNVSSTINVIRLGESGAGENQTVANNNIIYLNLTYEAA